MKWSLKVINNRKFISHNPNLKLYTTQGGDLYKLFENTHFIWETLKTFMERVKKSKIKLQYKDVINNFFYLKTSGKLSSNDIKKPVLQAGVMTNENGGIKFIRKVII